MKTMSCKQLGGACDEKFHAETFEKMAELSQKHGMEMFQNQFQDALDEYVSGTIDEKEFLKKSEYFKRWGMDYGLYREILLYARQYGLPVIGLNISRDLVARVSQSGLLALSDEERAELPEFMDLTDNKYRKRLKKLFEEHNSSGLINFDFFFQAQVLWDESMAQNLNNFIKDNGSNKETKEKILCMDDEIFDEFLRNIKMKESLRENRTEEEFDSLHRHGNLRRYLRRFDMNKKLITDFHKKLHYRKL